MSIIENIIYGFISGLTEFLPVSSQGHQVLLRYLLGVESRNYIQEFLVHIGMLLSLVIGCREYLSKLKREQNFTKASRLRGRKKITSTTYFDLRLLKTALFPLVICMLVILIMHKIAYNLISVMVLMIVNSIVLFLADHSRRGNRDSGTMSALDGIIIGILGSLCALPGLSGIGLISCYTTLRGADSNHFVNWIYVLCIPITIIFIIFDIIGFVTVGAGVISFVAFLGYILAGLAAFAGGYLAISIFLAIINHSGFSQFAYYSIGTALITFLLYIIT